MQIPEEILFTTSTITDGNMSFRFGENMAVLENRKKFLAQYQVAWEQHICMRCNHGGQISSVNRTNYPTLIDTNYMVEAEVLVTQEPGLALMLLTADCLPTAFYDPITRTIALAHFSRETIAVGLPEKTVGFLRQQLSVDPTNLHVFVGPHIHKTSYGFPLPLASVADRIAPFVHKVNNQAYIDLPAAHQAQLTEAGVPDANVTYSKIDTFTSTHHFSHYESTRDSTKPLGRLATILHLCP